ncbi:MAG: efflux transporter periplasmic adaptor subunit [Desulfuromonadales bacterium GWD2_61_12]|nr:MAG: efflux transporter periplasmic adaptor subunit [Desulfuromonadales bacterium GWC2_61_20]OGR32387.1 MAG: efflux transporter periplasmic adaptor subunit [Desulfuromonadales bacterium GWD2_61_12]
MKRTESHRSLLSFLLLGTLALAGCGKEAAKGGPPPAPEVGVITLQPQRVALTTELSGRTTPYQIAEVRPQVGGIIQKRLFTEGTEVRAGQTLYQIDPATYRAALASAEANLARAEANLLPARLKAERYRELIAIKAISQQDDDNAQAALKQAEADIAAAKAAVDNARINLQYTSITAPISGRIGRSSVTAGALVTANQEDALATIQQLDPIYVDVSRSSSEMLQLRRQFANGTLKTDAAGAARVKLRFEDGSPYPRAGALKFSEASVDPGTGTVTLRTLFPNPELLLLPGMFVRAVIEEGIAENALLVPQRGVTRDQAGNPTALVVGAGEKVEVRLVKVVRTVGENWLVEDGLKPGDRVILEGLQRLRPGSVVKAVPFGVPAAEKKP